MWQSRIDNREPMSTLGAPKPGRSQIIINTQPNMEYYRYGSNQAG